VCELHRSVVKEVVATEGTGATQAETGGQMIVIINILTRKKELKLRDNWRNPFLIG